MTHPIAVPDEAVEAALDALAYGCGDMWPDMQAALIAALPHILPAMTETINRVCDRADELEAASRSIPAAAALLRAAGWRVDEPRCDTCGGWGNLQIGNSLGELGSLDCPTCNGTGAAKGDGR